MFGIFESKRLIVDFKKVEVVNIPQYFSEEEKWVSDENVFVEFYVSGNGFAVIGRKDAERFLSEYTKWELSFR